MEPARVCVYAGSRAGASPLYSQAARDLGRALVRRGYGLVYGGGSVGLMGTIADQVLADGGEVIGVIPDALDRREIAHAGLSQLHVVGTIHERKALMARLAGAFIALPGGLGTLEEVMEALTWTQLGLHTKPVGLLQVNGFWQDLEHQLDQIARHGFMGSESRGLLQVSSDPDQLLDQLERWHADPRPRAPELAEIPPRGPLIGASAVVVRDGRVLLGRRRGAHGEGTFAFPGGKPDPGESPETTVARELLEETGLVAQQVRPLIWTNDLFPGSGLHFITLHHLVTVAPDAQPQLREPHKCDGWAWYDWQSPPTPLFGPAEALRATGWRPPPG